LKNIEILNKFVDYLPYIYFNDNLYNNGVKLPRCYENGMSLIKLALINIFTPDVMAKFTND
jgi:hypothetical protein